MLLLSPCLVFSPAELLALTVVGSVKVSSWSCVVVEKDDGAEEEGKSEKCDSRCRGSKCPWKNISSAGERSMTDDEEVDDGESAVGVCKCRDTVKEKSCGCEADDDDS